jgi:purine-cytosine permease-like protein
MAPAGLAETGDVLSFGAAVVGFALGWASLGADCKLWIPSDIATSLPPQEQS